MHGAGCSGIAISMKFAIDQTREKWYIIRCVIMPLCGGKNAAVTI